MIYRFHCQCGATFDVDERVIGKRLTCAECHRRTVIDAASLEPLSLYRLTCDCGTTFRVEEKAVGGTFRCPKCQGTIHIDRDRLAEVPREREHVSRSPRATVPVDFKG
jgi:Zn finger protein HypA/HybF involved in hydrogenase expression